MFNYEDALKSIKAIFSQVEAPAAPVALEALEYKLTDGTAVMIDKIEVGGTVTVAGQPAPDGEHTLEDGTVLVTVGGAITEVKAPQQLPAPDAPEDLSTPEKMVKALQKFAEPGANPDLQKMAIILKACFENVFGWQIREAQEKATRDAAIEVYKQGFQKQQEGFNQLVSVVEHLTKAPTSEPAAPAPAKFKAQQAPADQKKEWLASLSDALTKINK